MKSHKLFALFFAISTFFCVQSTYAHLSTCIIGNINTQNTFISCGSDPAGGYINVRNTSSATSPLTIHIYPNDGPSIELKPNATTPLIYMWPRSQIECENCTYQNIKIYIAAQCKYPPTNAEHHNSTCQQD